MKGGMTILTLVLTQPFPIVEGGMTIPNMATFDS